MNKKQVILLVIAIVFLGSFIEVVKNVRVDSSQQRNEINSMLSGFDVTPFARNFEKGALSNSKKPTLGKRQRFAKNARPMDTLNQLAENQAGEHAFSHETLADKKKKKKKATKKNKKKEGEEDDKEKQAEENKNKDGEKEFAKQEDEIEDAPEESEIDENNNSEYVGTTGVISPDETDVEEETPIDEQISEWAEKILKFADFKVMDEFISLRQSGQISDEVFYAVILMTLEDSRENMRLLGARALGATPSMRSFDLIVYYKASTTFGSQMSTQLTQHLQNYSSLQTISILKDVLYSSENLDSIKTAAQLVDQAVQSYGESTTTQPSADADVQSLEQSQKKNASLFQGFTSILTSLSQSATDQDVASAAAGALSHIQKYFPDSTEDEVAAI